MSSETHLVVIGNGMAGARVVEEILQRGGRDRFCITMFGEEPQGNYNRILLSGVLSGSHDARDIVTHPLEWYAENDITLHAGERVVGIDRERRVVAGASGREVPFDTLILATGSRPRVPPIENLRDPHGRLKAGVFLFRSLEDCRRISDYASGCRRAVVIGGGLLGLEAAYGLSQLGVDVEVLQRAGHLMNRQLDSPAGEILKSTIEGMGISVRRGTTAIAAQGDERVEGLVLNDGTCLPCDMVVIACGIQPNVELAVECGLHVERAIVVDDQMRSSDPAIYAVGECVQHRGRVYGLVAPLWEQAQVLAEHLTGRSEGASYGGSRVATRLKVMGIEVTAMGLVEPEAEHDEVVQFLEPRRGIYKKLIIREDRLLGAIFLGDGARAPYATQLFDRGSPVPEDRAAVLFDLGAGTSFTPETMAEEATVCHCNGVTKAEVRECVAGGGCSLQAVMRATRAGTGCGSCKGLVREFVERFRKTADPVGAAG